MASLMTQLHNLNTKKISTHTQALSQKKIATITQSSQSPNIERYSFSLITPQSDSKMTR